MRTELLVTLGLLLSALTPIAAGASDSPHEGATPKQADQLFTKTVPVRPGDHCIVCGTPLQAGDNVYLVEGQRVGIMKAMEPTLFQDPWAYLARLKPRGGLFGGEMAPGGSPSAAWLAIGFYVTLGLGFAAVCAHRAVNTGRNAIAWFFGGLSLNAFAYLALLLRSAGDSQPSEYAGMVKIPATAEPQPCGACGALNHPCARACSICGASFSPLEPSEAEQARL